MFSFALLIGLSFVSCSNEIDSVEKSDSLTTVKNELNSYTSRKASEIDTAFVVKSTKIATINFTNEIKAFYTDGMSFSDLKHELDPIGELTNITPVGDELLQEAYSNIVNKVKDDDVNGLKMTKALLFIAESSFESGVVNVEDVDFESGSKELFGLDDSYVISSKMGGCSWYQVGCLLSSLWSWLSADANGDAPGTTTNGQVLASVISILGGLAGLGTTIFGGN